ncbi:MAG: electron transfer flavoprotein subunit beta [Proteobacteria bacterium]|nr:electron transfer flavoprotein subunit beta [Pseudomonadota bacterium]
MALEVAVLVSLGRHPASGRLRPAGADARAVELALRLPDARLHVIHAGDPAEPALRDYLGMGVASLTVLDLPEGADPVPALADHLKSLQPAIVLTGQRAEAGEDSGLLPYLLAEALGAALVPAVVEVKLDGDAAALLQALPRGRRRDLRASLPLVATVSPSAPAPRLPAFGPARRGRIETLMVKALADAARSEWKEKPARRRPKRLKVMGKGGSAADRVKAVTEMQGGKGKLLTDVTPEAAAEAVWAYLVEEGIVRERGGENS